MVGSQSEFTKSKHEMTLMVLHSVVEVTSHKVVASCSPYGTDPPYCGHV